MTWPFALFTAGPTGAGKSVMVAQLLSRYALLSLDLDAITARVAERRPSRPYWQSRPTALRLLDRWQAPMIERSIPMVINTTAADLPFVLALRDRLAGHGYRGSMLFVDAPPEHCRVRNAARAHPVPDAAVERSVIACAANRSALEHSFPHFISIANRSGVESFQEDIRTRIFPRLDAIGVPRWPC